MNQFKQAVQSKNNNVAISLLNQLKIMMIDFDTLLPNGSKTISPSSKLEKISAIDVLENAIILSINLGDKDLFARHISSLRTYYHDFGDDIQSNLKYTMIGLNLLYLLVENKLAEFHCELELLTTNEMDKKEIAFCTQLDQHLMVGSYDHVLAAAENPPVSYYVFFLKSLLETVRMNISDCAAASYSTLTTSAATKILMFSSEKETLQFISQYYPDWSVNGSLINLRATKSLKSEEIPSLKVISQSLTYATELERIV